MARAELVRSGLLAIDPQAGSVNYRDLFEKTLQLLQRDDERYLHIAKKLDALILSLEDHHLIESALVRFKLQEIADYSRVMAGELPIYRKRGLPEKRYGHDGSTS